LICFILFVVLFACFCLLSVVIHTIHCCFSRRLMIEHHTNDKKRTRATMYFAISLARARSFLLRLICPLSHFIWYYRN
jgi:hypothetical protein